MADHEAELTPPIIVEELDKHIIAQKQAKRAVAIALRNRYRRRQVPPDLQDEIYPKNILMIGNTGVGKTEIARRLAKLAAAPFIKVEATKFSQIGYVGRDVESIIRDLIQQAVTQERTQKLKSLKPRAKAEATELILDCLLPESSAAVNRNAKTSPSSPLDTLSLSFAIPQQSTQSAPPPSATAANQTTPSSQQTTQEQFIATRAKLKNALLKEELEDKAIDLYLTPAENAMPQTGINISGLNLGDQQMDALNGMMKNLGNMFRPKKVKQRIKIKDARPRLIDQVAESMLDMNSIIAHAKHKTETMGIVFIDEIDKIVSNPGEKHGNMDVSREGVQRDILPLVEGCTVSTSFGMVQTDHILFIAAGAFHISAPSNMIPELQGRFPIRVKLTPLKANELRAILVQPKNALIKQYQALLATEGITLEFKEDAIDEIARSAEKVNQESENIGARRLATLMEKLLEDLLFYGKAPPKNANKKFSLKQILTGKNVITLDSHYVKECFKDILPNKNLNRYIL